MKVLICKNSCIDNLGFWEFSRKKHSLQLYLINSSVIHYKSLSYYGENLYRTVSADAIQDKEKKPHEILGVLQTDHYSFLGAVPKNICTAKNVVKKAVLCANMWDVRLKNSCTIIPRTDILKVKIRLQKRTTLSNLNWALNQSVALTPGLVYRKKADWRKTHTGTALFPKNQALSIPMGLTPRLVYGYNAD